MSSRKEVEPLMKGSAFAPRIDMTTCVYEPIDQKAGEKPRYIEIKQGMNDAPLGAGRLLRLIHDGKQRTR